MITSHAWMQHPYKWHSLYWEHLLYVYERTDQFILVVETFAGEVLES